MAQYIKNQIHNHPPNNLPKTGLNDSMKLEISRFTKRDKVSSIREHLETNCRLSYSSVYNEFR